MKILTGKEIKAADAATMKSDNISSLELMERAAEALSLEIAGKFTTDTSVTVFCGKGNNGGDGFAVARMLSGKFNDVSVVTLSAEEEMTPECRTNFRRLPSSVRIIRSAASVEEIFSGKRKVLIVDAVLGVGIRGPVKGPAASLVRFINESREALVRELGAGAVEVVSIDLPSGLPSEFAEDEGSVCAVVADRTLTVGLPKLSLLLPATGKYAGKLTVVPIGLSRSYIDGCQSPYLYADEGYVRKIMPERNAFAHKGNFGHALIVAGRQGMMGAAMLATGAALRSGCGLVTAHVPFSERLAVHLAHPSAIVSTDSGTCFSCLPRDMSAYSAVCAGPGLGQSPETASALRGLLESGIPAVMDADALNVMSANPDMLRKLPHGCVLTPHVGELRRLLKAASGISLVRGAESGEKVWRNEEDKLRMVGELACATGAVVVVKGAHTMVCPPDGALKFNSTGNPGMAKGGSGDVLAGLVAGLLARGLSAEDAAVAGVYFHGAAGDRAAEIFGEESMNASDILGNLRV